MSPRKARPGKPQPAKSDSRPALQRINKVLAAAGLGSRRQVDELIEQGRVEINGQVVTQVGIKVDLASATISVDGELLKQHRPVYYALHKPEGVLCTNRDPEGRPRVIDFVPNQHRLFPVGRLDASSTGLILLTNDGELAQQLAHPKHEIPKRYAVVVAGQVEVDALKRLERGIYLAEGKAQVDQAKLKKVRKSSSELEITLSEGKNREIRRVLARLGHKVVSLKRIAIGPLKLADLPEGAYRPLSNQEVQGLYQAVEEIRRERKAARKARKKLAAAQEASEEVSAKPTQNKPGRKTKPGKPVAEAWEKLPGISDNPYATQEDIDEESIDHGDDELILIRDHGPDSDSSDDSDEEYYFMPRKSSGSVIGQDDQEVDPMIEDLEESRPVPRGANRRGAKQGGLQTVGSKRSGPKEGGSKRGGSKRGGPMGSGPTAGGPSRGGPSRGGPKRGGPKRGGPRQGGPKQGGPKRGGGRSGRRS
ncbi:MAG: pseudouridine synthase [Pirellula sp.]